MPFMIDFINAQFQIHRYLYLLCSLQLNSNLYMHSFPTYHHSQLSTDEKRHEFRYLLGGTLTNTAIDLRDRRIDRDLPTFDRIPVLSRNYM
jgi:hypothetical protein